MSEPIVKKTLDPLLAAMGERPRSEALLNLVICDPAMGSGAFLVAACRYLADQVVAAWTREAAEETASLPGIGATPGGGAKTKLELLGDAHDDVVNHARRLVAQRCLYGVDKNKYAVQLARLSLWLVTMAKHEPFTFVDHSLRHGDSLVGLNFDQIRAFHWQAGQKGEQVPTASVALQQALDEAVGIRQGILDLAADPSPKAQREKELLLVDSQDAIARARLIADLVVGAFFSEGKAKAREQERLRRLDLVERWLGTESSREEDELRLELNQLQAQLWETQVPFHWHLEFPEVFYLERPDPLDGGKTNGAAMVDGFVGNPPFAGGLSLSGMLGNAYIAWGSAAIGVESAKADLSAYFFRRCAPLLGQNGALGLIATNTIGQGDTRESGLAPLLHAGLSIYEATASLSWPGDAAVTVSVVHISRGRPRSITLTRRLDGRTVKDIDSYLRARKERSAPQKLSAMASVASQGCITQGAGFVLTLAEGEELRTREPLLSRVVRPYIGGAEVNTDPSQDFDRYVVNFGMRSLEECSAFPTALAIVRERVKPSRDLLREDQATARKAKELWWRFWAPRAELYAAIEPLPRCLVTARLTKHLVFCAQPTNRVFSEQLYVFPLAARTAFAVLQSRSHEVWARLLSSSMKTDLRYSASDCFQTFPFPQSDPRTVTPELEDIGERLYDVRAKYMVDTDQGLTKTYNALKDPSCTDERILELRELHEEMDRAVLRAYPKLPGVGSPDSEVVGWSDIVVPPFCVATDADRAALQVFEDEVIDRLFVLNADRAKKEAALGRGAKKGAAGKAGAKPRGKKKTAKKARKKAGGSGQGSLGF